MVCSCHHASTFTRVSGKTAGSSSLTQTTLAHLECQTALNITCHGHDLKITSPKGSSASYSGAGPGALSYLLVAFLRVCVQHWGGTYRLLACFLQTFPWTGTGNLQSSMVSLCGT